MWLLKPYSVFLVDYSTPPRKTNNWMAPTVNTNTSTEDQNSVVGLEEFAYSVPASYFESMATLIARR